MQKNEQKIESYIRFCQARGVSQRGLEIVKEIITNPPYRRVNTQSMSPNLTCRFPSRKMSFTIQAESRSMELSSIYLKESDSSVIGYWDQPAHRPSLSYKSGSRNVRVSVTLDFFVISDEFIGFEECKPLETLRKLCLKKPERFCFDEGSGEYNIPPLDAYLQGTGLGHRVISDQQIDKTYVENLAFLYDLLDESVTSEDRQRWVAAKKLVDAKGGLTIKQIEQSIIGLSRISLLTAIAHRELYVDFYMQHLKEPERVFVYANADVAKSETLALEKIDVAPELMVGSAQEVTEALERFKTIEPLIDGADIRVVSESQKVSVRTLQRWLKSYRDDGLQGLQPKHGSKGNAVSRLPKAVDNCITEIIESYYLDNQARKPFHVYQLLKSKCQEMGLQPPSRQAFYDRFKPLSDSSVLKVREGAKRAYQATGYEGLEDGNNGHSFVSVSRFLERCHIDHTQVDIQLVSADGANLGKPWLTLIIDEISGFILAVYLSFRNPGVPALMSAIRLMVKQHGVIPEAVVVDGGKEFESIYFETLMARHRCMIISRKGKPRAGGPVERIFGTINSVFLDNLAGNNKLAKNIRQLSASHHPKKLAIWEAVDFYHALLAFTDDWNHKSKKSAGLSPADLKDKLVERLGLREKRKVSFNQNFLRDVLPEPKRATVRLRRNKTIQVNRVAYWHGCLRGVSKDGVTVSVRFDPFDLNYVYVYYKNEWLRFKSSHSQHPQLDDLDAAIVAEVARHSLVVNEQAKTQGRMEMAVAIESSNKQAIKQSNDLNIDAINTEDPESSPETERDLFCDDIWALEIPDSTEAN